MRARRPAAGCASHVAPGQLSGRGAQEWAEAASEQLRRSWHGPHGLSEERRSEQARRFRARCVERWARDLVPPTQMSVECKIAESTLYAWRDEWLQAQEQGQQENDSHSAAEPVRAGLQPGASPAP